MVVIAHITPPEAGLVYSSNDVQLKINERIVGKGKLYITSSALAWQPDNTIEGISIQWTQISVHGVSSNPRKCIYFMLDHKLFWRGVYEGLARVPNGMNGNGAAGRGNAPVPRAEPVAGGGGAAADVDEGNETDEDEYEEEDEHEHITECWLMPDDVNTVDTIFEAMTECQALHPDSADSISAESDFMDDDGADDNGLQAIGPLAGGDEDGANAAQGMQNLNINDERFADADE